MTLIGVAIYVGFCSHSHNLLLYEMEDITLYNGGHPDNSIMTTLVYHVISNTFLHVCKYVLS